MLVYKSIIEIFRIIADLIYILGRIVLGFIHNGQRSKRRICKIALNHKISENLLLTFAVACDKEFGHIRFDIVDVTDEIVKRSFGGFRSAVFFAET